MLWPQVVVLNKVDLPHVQEKVPALKEALLQDMGHTRIMEISAATGLNTQELMQRVRKLLNKIDGLSPSGAATTAMGGGEEEDDGMEPVQVTPLGTGRWRVVHPALEKLANALNFEDDGDLERFLEVVEALGVGEQLEVQGGSEGDVLLIGEMERPVVYMSPMPAMAPSPAPRRR